MVDPEGSDVGNRRYTTWIVEMLGSFIGGQASAFIRRGLRVPAEIRAKQSQFRRAEIGRNVLAEKVL